MIKEAAKFDAVKVAALSAEIVKLMIDVDDLTKKYQQASSDLSAVRTSLSNKKIEFTRAVESQLENSTLNLPRSQEQPCPKL